MIGRYLRLLICATAIISTAFAVEVLITAGPVIETAESTSAVITWSTNQPSSSRVWYSEDSDDLTQIAEGAGQTTEHRVLIEGLQPNTTYFFQVEVPQTAASSPMESPAVLSFRTVAPGQNAIHNQRAIVAQKGLAPNEPREPVVH
jgi:hypothetical protein